MVARDYGLGGAIVRRSFPGNGNEYEPGNVLMPADMAKILPENRFHLVRSGYIELNEDQGENLTADIQRVKEENDNLKAENESLKSEIEKWKKEAEALRGAIHEDKPVGETKPDRDLLKEKADALGIEYPRNIKTEKLSDLIKEKETE